MGRWKQHSEQRNLIEIDETHLIAADTPDDALELVFQHNNDLRTREQMGEDAWWTEEQPTTAIEGEGYGIFNGAGLVAIAADELSRDVIMTAHALSRDSDPMSRSRVRRLQSVGADPVVESVIQQFRERSAKGLIKYRVGLDRTDLSTLEWVQHAKEESMDFSLYLERLQMDLSLDKHDKRLLDAYASGQMAGLTDLLREAQGELAALRGAATMAEARARQGILGFVARVNARAEAEMLATGTLEGAHNRAIEAELSELG